MQPAKKIVHSLGGPAAVARELGITMGGVCRWYMASPRGSDGRIPGKYIAPLCEMARRLDIFLEPNQFYPERKSKKKGRW
jgi:hypothetical protein